MRPRIFNVTKEASSTRSGDWSFMLIKKEKSLDDFALQPDLPLGHAMHVYNVKADFWAKKLVNIEKSAMEFVQAKAEQRHTEGMEVLDSICYYFLRDEAKNIEMDQKLELLMLTYVRHLNTASASFVYQSKRGR